MRKQESVFAEPQQHPEGNQNSCPYLPFPYPIPQRKLGALFAHTVNQGHRQPTTALNTVLWAAQKG